MKLWNRSWPPAAPISSGCQGKNASQDCNFRAGRAVCERPYRPDARDEPTPGAWEMRVSTLMTAPLACCRWELESRRMVPPSNEALRLVIETDGKLVADLNGFYGDATPDGGLDKLERDRLLDLLGRHYTGR